MKKIKVNKVQCKICNDIIESKYTHDVKHCSCGRIGVDGGLDYLKRTFDNENDFIELSEYENDDEIY